MSPSFLLLMERLQVHGHTQANDLLVTCFNVLREQKHKSNVELWHDIQTKVILKAADSGKVHN